MPDKLQNSSDFANHLNTMFQIRLDGIEAVCLELVRVTEAASRSGLEARQPFSLLFLGPVSSQYLVQHIYRLEHEQMGALDLFLVPLGPEQGRMQYEAIFT